MARNDSNQFRAYLRMMLQPILRFALRHAIRIQELTEDIKAVLAQVAAQELASAGAKANVSRVSVMTGLHRREVMRFTAEPAPRAEALSVTARILGQWEQDPRFLTKLGKPRMLKISDTQNEFKLLIESVSQDLNYGTVLFELQRIGAVAVSDRGVALARSSVIDRDDVSRGFKLLAQDVADIIVAVEENLSGEKKTPHLHARTEYDNLDPAACGEIRQWLLDEGAKFHQKAREFLSKRDRDINPPAASPADALPGAKVSLVTFSLTEDVKRPIS